MANWRKFAIIRLESPEHKVVSWGKTFYPNHAVIQVTDYQRIHEETRGVIGTVVGRVDTSTDLAVNAANAAWDRFHRDNCACGKAKHKKENCPCERLKRGHGYCNIHAVSSTICEG